MKDYFCGWYFKSQSDEKTLAVIAAYHRSKKSASSSVQLITDNGAWNVDFPYESFRKERRGFEMTVGKNSFGASGMTLDISEPGLTTSGRLGFGGFTPIKYDIMGPFALVPFMECRHSVVSMYHTVNGVITLNGEEFVFDNAHGYIEGDRGRSFPKVYSWTQCVFDGGSLMLSVADIPFGLVRFTGIIGVVYLNGKEYRIATYKGAKAVKIKDGCVTVKQGKMLFTARLVEKHAMDLNAPVNGEMTRTIRESASCRAAYTLEVGGEKLLDLQTDKASFEYEYPE